ncbi:Importin-9 [Araneus ventricosus]|uniref:Importin-9 n=1 Tax=Araneus ventricosus TaxID=182803 RepID=A0A4Y2ACB3_ARAVE|nr:Importin-9 [Araneus ventricosus]
MAAPMRDVNRTLKDALFETLTSILSPIHDVRIGAEQQISALEVTDEFAVHLTELMLDQHAPLAIRQLASVLLRQYVESHWSRAADKFRPPETTSEAKAAVRGMLPMGLHESISKLRSSAAYAISAIAQWDWPEEWPELFDILLRSLVSENSCAVHGAMRVLKEISNEVSDSQMPQFAPVILPEMLKIFLQDQKYGIRTRGRAVEIFSTCAEIIGSMAPYNKVLIFPP